MRVPGQDAALDQLPHFILYIRAKFAPGYQPSGKSRVGSREGILLDGSREQLPEQ
jgi:hypothetical protein